MRFYDFKVVLQLKLCLIQDPFLDFITFPLGLIISYEFMQMPVLNKERHLFLHLNPAWFGPP